MILSSVKKHVAKPYTISLLSRYPEYHPSAPTGTTAAIAPNPFAPTAPIGTTAVIASTAPNPHPSPYHFSTKYYIFITKKSPFNRYFLIVFSIFVFNSI